jgi:hypothetical protein
MVSVTLSRLPDIGRRAMSSMRTAIRAGRDPVEPAGKLVAEASTGTAERFDVMSEGRAAPPSPLGMLWYALRDRL